MIAEKRKILQLAVTAGEILLKNGAEIVRVQETIGRILSAYGIQTYTDYVIANGIFVTIDEECSHSRAALRYAPSATVHLGRIAAVNEISRQIEQSPDPRKIQEYLIHLTHCAHLPYYPPVIQLLSCGVGSFSFCFLMGGSFYDNAVSFICGAVLQLFLIYFGNNKLSRFMPTILGAGLVSIMACIYAHWFPFVSLDYASIGAIMPLVPGVAVTTAIRDFFNGDSLSGIMHLTDALLTGICIAVGVGVSQQLWALLLGGSLI